MEHGAAEMGSRTQTFRLRRSSWRKSPALAKARKLGSAEVALRAPAFVTQDTLLSPQLEPLTLPTVWIHS